MRIAITGATGFVGSHLTHRLESEGRNAVAHCAGINRETGVQTYERNCRGGHGGPPLQLPPLRLV